MPALTFLRFRDSWLLLMSCHKSHVEDWFIGNWDRQTLQFQPQTSGVLDYNEASYATQGLYHPDGRVIYWNTFHQWRQTNRPVDWPGCLSLPRELSIGDDNRLCVQPLSELSQLRGAHLCLRNLTLSDETEVLKGVRSDTLEICATIQSKDAKSVGLVVRRSHDGTRGLELRHQKTFFVDGTEA